MTWESSIAQHASYARDDMGVDPSEVIGDIVELITKRAQYAYDESSLGDACSGYSKSLGGGRYLIGFNRDHYFTSSFHRFTVAHELGHLSLPEHRATLDSTGEHRSNAEYQSEEVFERQADYFAISFLAPSRAFQHEAAFRECSRKTVEHLACHFGISLYAAARRFIELTDLSCALLVCNDDGQVEYERRSERMRQAYRHRYLYRIPVSPTSLTADLIKGASQEYSTEIRLNDWYEDLPVEIPATESVIRLNYNKKYLTLIVPHVADPEEVDELD